MVVCEGGSPWTVPPRHLCRRSCAAVRQVVALSSCRCAVQRSSAAAQQHSSAGRGVPASVERER